MHGLMIFTKELNEFKVDKKRKQTNDNEQIKHLNKQ